MPPEAVRAVYEPRPIDLIIADCWSFGAVLFQMLTYVFHVMLMSASQESRRIAAIRDSLTMTCANTMTPQSHLDRVWLVFSVPSQLLVCVLLTLLVASL
jgi:hypothetical protein